MLRPIAFITPSYENDLPRCRLLCESMDRMAQGAFNHYILVADHDVALFKPLESTRRKVLSDRMLLPRWLKAVRRPLSPDGRWMWLSINPARVVWPMSGWHVQQLRKLLIARHIDEDVLVMADSDSIFVRPFSNDVFLRDGKVRLYRRDNAITPAPDMERHVKWAEQAAEVLGLPRPGLPAHDYINNLVTWRRDEALACVAAVEERTGRELAAAMGRYRTFSEYQLYGAFVDSPDHGSGHFRDPAPLSHTYWSGAALTPETFEAFSAGLSPGQIAVCIQSFTQTSTELLRIYVERPISAR